MFNLLILIYDLKTSNLFVFLNLYIEALKKIIEKNTNTKNWRINKNQTSYLFIFVKSAQLDFIKLFN